MPPKYSRQSAPLAASATSVSDSGLPVSIVSSSDSSRFRSRRIAAARVRTRPRSAPVIADHPACAASAEDRAASTTAAVAAWTVPSRSPVAG
jgi:hypothetical protein